MSNLATVNLNLPYANPSFSAIREKNKIYVDKTALIYEIASQDVPIFFSRPRRFGKSLLINTLSCLFSTGLKYFAGLDIEKMWVDKTYKVVRLDFSDMAYDNSQDFKRDLGAALIQEFSVKGSISQVDELGMRNPSRILDEIALNLKNNSTVLLIDEYDAPLIHNIEQNENLNNIPKILNNFYATIKKHTGKFRLIFITGVTRSSHVSIFSAFNNLIDLSFKKEFNSILGFSRRDLVKYFDPYIEIAANILKISKDDVYRRLEENYDGFQFSLDASETVYNPWSIISFFKFPEDGFKNYWFDSGGTPSLLMQALYANKFNEILNNPPSEIILNFKELTNKYEIKNIPYNVLLYQTGYLTIRKYTNKLIKLIFPNIEIEDSIFQLSLLRQNINLDIEQYCDIDEFVKNIDSKNLSYLINIFNAILNEYAGYDDNIFHDERSIRNIIYAALPKSIEIQIVRERMSLRGRSDLEILTGKTNLVIEFKRTKANRDAKASLKEAIEQLQSKNYGQSAFKNYQLFRVAIVVSTKDKEILEAYSQEVI